MGDDQRQPLTDDDDLAKRSKRDDFWIKRSFKWFTLALIIFLLVFLAYYFCKELISNDAFRNSILDQIKSNIIGIIVAGLAIIGINVKRN